MTATISTNERVCGTCNKTKDVSQFYKDGKDSDGAVRYRRDCKECYRITRLSNRRVKSKSQSRAAVKKGGKR